MCSFLILQNQICVFTDSLFFEVEIPECKHTSHCAPVLAEICDARG